jgi:hypothetical protein
VPRPRDTFRLILPALLLASFCLSIKPEVAVAEPPAPDPSSPYGIAGVMRWPNWGTFSRPIDYMLETGGAWVREDFVWGLIEPRERQYDWTATDRIVGNLHERKVNVLGIISYSVNWATPAKEDDNSPNPISFYAPDHDKYYLFVHGLVSRYKGTVHHWEIWNEPDNTLFWRPRPDAREYAGMLKVAYRAVKDADPTAKVLTGGVSGNAIPFLEEMMAGGGGASFDILALHPYAVPLDKAQARVESRPEVHKMVDVELTKYRAFLQRHKLDRPIWVTEMGWPARDWQLDDQAQADYLAQAYAQMLASGLAERIFWYSWKDSSPDPVDSWGLIGWGAGKTDLTPKRPAFAAYSTSAHMLSGTKPAGRVQVAPFQVVEGFEQAASWTRSTHPQGGFNASGEQHHGGSKSGKLEYNFTGKDQAVDFASPEPRPIPGKPTRLGLWVKGDASGNYLSAWLRDKDGELFKVRLGAVTGSADGWRYYESRINNYYFDWERALGNPANGAVDYPVSFISFRLENTPDEPAGSGTIYVDDLQVYDGPDVSAVRFTRTDGQVVDVLWSVDPSQVSLPTGSARAQVTERDGATKAVEAKDGKVALSVSSKPIYVLHKPGDTPGSAPLAGASAARNEERGPSPPPTPRCLAAVKAEPSQEAGSRYFAETGHNVGGRFRTYWEQNGGTFIFGYPITEEFTDTSSDGKAYRQQLFERARFEYHPENSAPNDVQLGLLGNWVTAGRSFQRSAQSNDPAAIFFPQTGHNLLLFKEWWGAHGGLSVFGYPISGELQERNAADGKTYTVQYFERNRLEYHPEYPGTDNRVLLGLLGVEYLAQQTCR